MDAATGDLVAVPRLLLTAARHRMGKWRLHRKGSIAAAIVVAGLGAISYSGYLPSRARCL